MKCSLFDITCQAQAKLLELWDSLGFEIKALFIVGAALIVIGVLWSVWGFLRSVFGLVKKVGGWPAVGGAIVVALAAVLAIFGVGRGKPRAGGGETGL